MRSRESGRPGGAAAPPGFLSAVHACGQKAELSPCSPLPSCAILKPEKDSLRAACLEERVMEHVFPTYHDTLRSTITRL